MNNSPYKFLDFYDFEDKGIFFGRESESNILVADVVVNRLVVLFARTGTGKTSLINAGVRPRLEERDFKTFYIRVEQHPTEAAQDVLLREKLIEEKGDVNALSTQLIAVVNKLEKPIVLFFDQFEEFFIQISSKETRRQFVSEIAEIYHNADSGVHFVFSMREEYFHEMDEFRAEIPSIFHKNSNLRLLQLNADQARIAIINPAHARGVEVEKSLVDKLIHDLMQDEGIRPTNLQIVCDTLWRNNKRDPKKITLKEYQEFGEAQHILNQRLSQDIEKALSGTNFLPLMQKLIPELRTEKDTKYPRVFSDLVKLLNTPEETLQDLISRLKSVQVVKDTTISGAYGIEWASDYLAERTKIITGLVKTIELKSILQAAIKKANAEPVDLGADTPEEESPNASYLSVDDLEQFAQNIAYLTNLTTKEIEFLLDSALVHQRHMRLWFDLASKTDPNAFETLSKKIHDKGADLNLRKGAINLLDDLGTDQALHLLEEALDEPDLSDRSIDAIIEFPGDQAKQLLAKLLERNDLWDAIVYALGRTGTARAVALLKPLLQQDTKFFQTLNALERLAKSSSQVGSEAEKALETALPYLEKMLKSASNSDSAKSALIRLAKFREPLGVRAQNILLQADALPTETKELSDRKLSERIKDLPVKETPGGGLRRRVEKEKFTSQNAAAYYFEDLMPFIRKGTVIPIISNSFRIDQIFRDEKGLQDLFSETAAVEEEEELTIGEQITREWARYMEYPMADDHNLARVAQFFQVEQKESLLAKAKYLKFLNNFLLDISEEDEIYRDVVKQMRTQETSFSDIVRNLDYPRFPSGIEDPLRLLAKLPLKTYVTTSYHNFMEWALMAEGKNPRTQICFWSGGRLTTKPEHSLDPFYEPTESQPAVYHLYGLEDYPQTLVLSEDDYLNFLISVVEDTNTQKPIVPLSLREGLAESRLIFLGYQTRDWDSRILQKFVAKYRSPDSAPRAMIIQRKPHAAQPGNTEKSMQYLTQYFDRKQFEIDWTSPEKFVQKLWNEWDKYGKGQS